MMVLYVLFIIFEKLFFSGGALNSPKVKMDGEQKNLKYQYQSTYPLLQGYRQTVVSRLSRCSWHREAMKK